MNNLQVINQQEILGRDFKIYGTVENPLFLAKDVAEVIENKNVSQMLNVVDEDEKAIYNVYTLGGSQDAWFLTEYGLYEVLMQSRKPIAKQFKKQIKGILKSLRLGHTEISNIRGNMEENNQTNEFMDMINNLASMVNTVMEQNSCLIGIIGGLTEEKLNSNFEKESIQKNLILVEDEVEKEIKDFQHEVMRIQSFCDFINSKGGICKRIGVQSVNQLLRDNGILDKYNNPTIGGEKYFIREGNKCLITKQGMIMLYRLIKEQMTPDYIVRR
jgi:prophage antirepressor-like protein